MHLSYKNSNYSETEEDVLQYLHTDTSDNLCWSADFSYKKPTFKNVHHVFFSCLGNLLYYRFFYFSCLFYESTKSLVDDCCIYFILIDIYNFYPLKFYLHNLGHILMP